MGRVPLFIPLAVLVAMILIGDCLGLRSPRQPLSYGRATYSAYLLSVSEAKSNGRLAVAEISEVDSRRIKAYKARLHFIGNSVEPVAGMRVVFRADLRPLPSKFQIPDAVDLMADMRRQGVTAAAVVVPDSIISIYPTKTLRYYAATLNNSAMERLMRSGLNDSTIDILGAMLLGRSIMIAPDTRQIYSAAGLSHLLALSGMHVAIISMIFSVALWPFYFGRHLKTRLFLTLIALAAYAALTGFMPSVTRAVIMAGVYMFGRIIQRKSPPLNSLCLAAIMILIVNPSDLYAAGFQMSFAAVLGIILFFPLINRVNRREHPELYWLASYPALSISAVVLTSVICAFHFHTFPLWFLPANLMVAPLIPPAIISGVISLTFETRFLSDFFVGAIDYVARLWAEMPGVTLVGLYPSIWQAILLIFALSLVGLSFNGKSRFMKFESLIILIGSIVIVSVAKKPRFAESEIYYATTPRYKLEIRAEENQCVISTDAKATADMTEIIDLYEIILRDFMAKRNIKVLTVTNGSKQLQRNL